MKTDILVPSFSSKSRTTTLTSGTFNLSATIVGGGVLSLPLAFAKCGVVLGTLLMIFAAIVTDRSLYLMCLCARQTGAASYGEVGKAAYGKYMEYFISLLLFVFLMFVLVAFMVLSKDIWTSVVQIVGGIEEPNGDFVLLISILIISPFLVQRTLHALRFNCYVGFGSVSILCFALCHRALTTTTIQEPLLLWSTSLEDVLFAFPIFTLSFMSVFNILPIQGALLQPSRTRMQFVIHVAVGSCFVLMLLFGLGGYAYAGQATLGNILLNCDHTSVFFLGLLGCGTTTLLAIAMVLLPCRESMLEVLDMLTSRPHIVPGEEIPLVGGESAAATKRRSLILHDSETEGDLCSTVAHYCSTFGIIIVCYVTAIRVPGVEVIWSLCGSSMAFLIAFILPAACYLEIQQIHPTDGKVWVRFAWGLLIFSSISALACSIQSVSIIRAGFLVGK
jgi:amino acid permease